MILRQWPMIAILPVALLGALGAAGPATAGSNEAAATCRQYVPNSGVTIAVDCGQPVAVLIKASASAGAGTCRRFVPSAQMSIEEPCGEPVAGRGANEPVAGTPAGTVVPAVKLPVQPAKGASGEKGDGRDAKAPAKAASLDVPSQRGCGGIVERAQLGVETEHDLKTLRSGCAPGG